MSSFWIGIIIGGETIFIGFLIVLLIGSFFYEKDLHQEIARLKAEAKERMTEYDDF